MAEKWMHRLGTLHQNQGVDYVEHDDDGSLRCLLCRTGWMFRKPGKHFHGSTHRKKYYAVKRAEEEAQAAEATRTRNAGCLSTVEWFQSYVGRVASLGLPQWQHHVQSQLFRSFFPSASNGSTICANGMTEEQKHSTLELILKYERMEVTSLLELALWKASIVSSGLFLSVHEMKEYPILDREFDAREYAARKREACGSAGVIPLVMTFL